ncbi:MAG TPA: electron transfer flavoprotein subunit beta/FixA family protein [Longimicrobiales bacterium]
MKIVVCIKRVPDTEARIRIASGGREIDPAGIKFVISPYDEFALETALRLKEAQGSGEVVAVTVGESTSGEQLRSALAMGADAAVLLKGKTSFDGLATAHALAAEMREQNADLVLLGMKAVDYDQQQVGPMLAELLDRPCITIAASVAVEGATVVCHREIEGGVEVVEAPLPAVVTITKGDFEPRYPSLKGIMAAKKKPLAEKDAHAAPSRIEVRELLAPPDRPPGRVVGEGVDAVPELVRLLREEAKVL